MSTYINQKLITRMSVSILILITILSVFKPSIQSEAGVSAGLLEYYIPGATEQLWNIFEDLDDDPTLVEAEGMHAVIAVTGSVDNTTIYYDHWEDTYDFDINDPENTYDEKYTINKGEVQEFESSNIPIPRGSGTMVDCGGSACYDGRDRIYVVGGAVTVTRASWPQSIDTVFALAWELFPTKPYLSHYTIPVGQDLAGDPTNYDDFDRVYVIVQSTSDNNNVQIDNPGTGTTPDIDITLNKGEVTELYSIEAGTTVAADQPVQVQLIVGQAHAGEASEARGLTVVPDDLWDNEYYSPVGGFAAGNTDLYIYNPNDIAIDVNYEDSSGSGFFTVGPKTTLSYSAGAGRLVPIGSSVHLYSTEIFWGIGSCDSEDYNYDWGFSLIPVNVLENEYFLGWAPGTSEAAPSNNGSPVYVTPVNDGTEVYVDFSPTDGTIDATYTLDRFDSQKIFDPDNENTGMHIWATGPIAAAYGEDPDTATIYSPYLDLGYTTLPMNEDWLDLVLGIDKTADPSVIPQGAGQTSTFTLEVNTYDYPVEDVDVVDTLPADWSYVLDSTTITLPDNSILTGASAEPSILGQELTWDLNHDMSAYETLTIVFQAITTDTAPLGFSENRAVTIGSRSNGSQEFIAEDNCFVYVTNLAMNKSSSAGGTVNPGETITYTVVISNPGGAASTNITVSDPLPIGTTYSAGSSQVTAPIHPVETLRDEVASVAYDGSNGTLDWSSQPWSEIGDDGNASAGDVRVTTDLGDNSFRIRRSGNGLERSADLTGYDSAQLSFEYRRQSFDNQDDYVAVEISSDGGTSWDELDRFQGPGTDSGYLQASFDIIDYAAADTVLRFISSGMGGFMAGTDYFYIDNVQIELAISGIAATNPGGDPPVLISASDGYDLYPGETMTVTFQVTVDDPPAAGQSQIVNVVYVTSDTQTNPLVDSVTDNLPPVDIGDLVWLDTDGDGMFDPGESGIPDVEVSLYNPGPDGQPGGGDDILIASTTTGPAGDYAFTGMPADAYFVDLNEATLPPDLTTTPGTTDPTFEFILVAGQNYMDADFGYQPSPTSVILTSFSALFKEDTIVLTWETSIEPDVLSFNIYRSEAPDDVPERLNDEILPIKNPGGLVGNIYQFVDQPVNPGDNYLYWLEIVRVSGVTRVGPVSAESFYIMYTPMLSR